MFTATVILTVILSLAYLGSGISKLAGAAQSTTQRDLLGVSPGLWRTIGALELAASAGLLVGLLVAPLGVAAAAGLVLLMIGAAVTHVRAGDTVHAPIPLVLGAVATGYIVVRVASW